MNHFFGHPNMHADEAGGEGSGTAFLRARTMIEASLFLAEEGGA